MVLGEPVCYTDSKIALFWIRGYEREWRQFVQNRVNEIRSLIPTNCWHHCSGETNPADLPSRGVDLAELTETTLWFTIPHHMCEPEQLNCEFTSEVAPEECLVELKAEARPQGVHNLLTNVWTKP